MKSRSEAGREPNQAAEAGSGGRRLGDGLLGDLDDFAEDLRLVNRQLAERFAIELDAGQDHAAHESRIVDSVRADGRGQTRDPQRAIFALLQAAVRPREGAGTEHRFLHAAQELPPAEEITASLFKQTFLGAVPRFACFDSHGLTSINPCTRISKNAVMATVAKRSGSWRSVCLRPCGRPAPGGSACPPSWPACGRERLCGA